MKTMRLSTQQQPGRFPHPLSTSRATCKTSSFGNTTGNYPYEPPYHPALCSKPIPASINSVPSNPSPPLLNLSTINQLRLQQCNFLASLVNNNANAREQMLKRQLMKAVMSQPSSVDYLDFLRRYAEDATTTTKSSSTIRQEFDYLDYIRRDAAEEFKRNGVEVTNSEDSRVTDHERGLGIALVGDTNLPTATSAITTCIKGRETTPKHVYDSAIISYGDFSTTSMSNHEPQESNLDTYNACPQKSENDFSATPPASHGNVAVRNHRNIFRNSRSHRRRRSTSAKRRDSAERRPLSRPCKTVSSASSTVGRKPKRSKPYDGFQRSSRTGATSNPNEKQKEQSYVGSRNVNPYDSDNSSSKTQR